MQLVLSNNRIIAHGENFLAMGGVVINTETGARYENATIAECNGCPSDIDKVGYEYHAGVFVPCAPYGLGNNNGFFMEVCESCATPRNSGIPIKNGLKAENMHPDFSPSQIGGMDIKLLWENASSTSGFEAQTITLKTYDWDFLIIDAKYCSTIVGPTLTDYYLGVNAYDAGDGYDPEFYSRKVSVKSKSSLYFGPAYNYYLYSSSSNYIYKQTKVPGALVPYKIYGVKL